MAIEEFDKEVLRILNSPYPTQLKHLHEVAAHCCVADLSLWTAEHPCQTDHLAKLIIAARPTWTYTDDLITALSCTQAARDAFLRHDPHLLHKLLQGPQPSAVATALLSHPLPDAITLPSVAQNFFIDAIDRAAQQPDDQFIEKLYTVLKGACSRLSDLISPTNADKIESQLLGIVSSTALAEGDAHSLYALACMQLMSTSTSIHFSKLQAYFTGHKAAKTLQLVVVKVIWVARSNHDDESLAELLRLANELVVCIPDTTRQEWCKSNQAYTKKLEEKIMNRSASGYQLRALLFLARLLSPAALHRSMRDTLLPYLATCEGLVELSSLCTEAQLTKLLSTVGSSACSSVINTITSVVLDTSSSWMPWMALWRSVKACAVLLRSTLDTKTAAAILSPHNTALLQRVVSGHAQPSDQRLCHILQRQRRRVEQELCVIMLHAASVVTQGALNWSNVEALPSPAQLQCTNCTFVEQPPALPELHQSSHDTWQGAIQSHLRHKLTTDSRELEHLFRLHCADLEKRCEDAEQPFHAEQAISSALRQQISDLEVQAQAYATTTSQLREQLQQSESNATALSSDLRKALQDGEVLADKLDTVERQHKAMSLQYHDSIQSLEQRHTTAKQEAAMQEAQYQARLTDLTEQASSQEKAAHTLNATMADQQGRISQLRQELDTTQIKLQQEHEAYCEEIKQHELAREAYARAMQDCDDLRQHALAQEETHAARLAALRQAAEEELLTTIQQHQAQARQELEQQRSAFDSQLEHAAAAFDELQASHTTLQTASEITKKQLLHQTGKLEQLKAACQAKDKENATLRGVRDKMLAAMGLQPAPEVDEDSTVADMPDHDAQATQVLSRQSLASTARQGGPRYLRRATSDHLYVPTPRSPLGVVSANISPSKKVKRRATVHKIMEEDDMNAFDEDDLLTSTTSMC